VGCNASRRPDSNVLGEGGLKIVNRVYIEIFTGRASGVMNGLDELKVLEIEVPPAIEVVARA
jgi:hypothetical protein